MDDQWPRALLRAALLEAGYDAVGARTVSEALTYPAADPGRGPVRLVIVDRLVLGRDARSIVELAALHAGPTMMLLVAAGESVPEGSWDRIIRRPVSIGGIVTAVQALLPLTSTGSGSIE